MQFNGFATVENPDQTDGYNPHSPDVFRPLLKKAPLVGIKGGQRVLCCRGLIEPSLMVVSEKLSRARGVGSLTRDVHQMADARPSLLQHLSLARIPRRHADCGRDIHV